MPCWAVVAAIREAEPSVERSAADRRAAEWDCLSALPDFNAGDHEDRAAPK